MKRSFVNPTEVVSYSAWKGSAPGSTRSSSSQKRSINLGSPKNNIVLAPSNKEFMFPLKKSDGGASKPAQVRYDLVSDETASNQQESQQDRPVSSSQVLTQSMGSPKGLQKTKFTGQKRGSLERSNAGLTQQNPLSNSITTSVIKASDVNNIRSSFNVESKKGKQGGLQISTDLSNIKYPLTNGGPSTTVAKSQTLKSKDLTENSEGYLKKSVASSSSFEAMLKSSRRNNSTRPYSSQNKAKPQTANSDPNSRKITQKCYTLEDEQEKPSAQQQKNELLNKLLAQTIQKGTVSPSSRQKPKSDIITARTGNTVKYNNFFSGQRDNIESYNQTQAKGSQPEDTLSFDESNRYITEQQYKSQDTTKSGSKIGDNLNQGLQQVSINITNGTQKSKTTKEVSLTVEKAFKDENNPESQHQASKSENTSLHSFVTKVAKGTTLSSSISMTSKQNIQSVEKTNKKPTLSIEETAGTQQKPPRGPVSKTPKATTNSENRVFNFENRVLQSSAQINVTSSQELRGQSTKNQKTTGSGPKVAKEDTGNIQKLTLTTKPVSSPPFIYYATSLEKHHRKYSERDYFCQLFREHFAQTFQAMMLVKYLKPVDPQVLNSKMINLPRRSGYEAKKTVVFDLDETLIHCNESIELPYHVKLPITFPHGEIVEAGINIRPYAVEALKELSQHFEIIVFTASHGCYANVVLDYLDPKGQYVHHRLFRESCVLTEEGIYVKDLRVLANRNLNDVVLIDNAAYSFAFQIDSGIPIAPYYDNPEDEELKHLIPYLKFLNGVKDMKDINRQNFKLHMYSQYESMEEVLENVVLAK